MTESVRDAMIEAAWMLIAERGLEGMSTREVLARTGAPRGSVYHYFPRGRIELVEAAIDRARRWMADRIAAIEPTSPGDVVDGYIAIWKGALTFTKFQAGCAAAGVVTGAQDQNLLDRGAAAFKDASDALAELFESVGMARADAGRNAILLTSAAEGGVLISRAQQSLEPLDTIAEQLRTVMR